MNRSKKDSSLLDVRLLMAEEAIRELIQIIQDEIIDERGYKKTPIGVIQARDKAEDILDMSDVRVRKQLKEAGFEEQGEIG
jgi:hypothetical protein